MKRILIIFLFLAYPLATQEADCKVLTILEGEVMRPYDRLLEAIIQVESSGNPLAVGDKHLKRHSYGILQIRQSRLDDFNCRTGSNYSTSDLFNVEVSKRIFFYYVNPDFETTCRLWNGGERGMNKKSTLKYWESVKQGL